MLWRCRPVAKRDLTALSLVFQHDDDSWAAFVWFFMPGDGVREARTEMVFLTGSGATRATSRRRRGR